MADLLLHGRAPVSSRNTKPPSGGVKLSSGDALKVRRDAIEVRGDALKVRHDAIEVRGDALEVRDDALEMRGDALKVRHDAIEVRGDALEVRCNALVGVNPTRGVCNLEKEAA